jgi:sulfate permease, SulP family
MAIRDEIKGAFSAAIITLPMAIAYGISSLAALGPDSRPDAALIGLNAAIFGGFFAALLGGTPTQISGPKAPLTLIMTALIMELAASPAGIQGSDARQVVALASISVFFGGAIQMVFSFAGWGNLIKYVPHPVVAGFMNGIAILLIRNQIPPFLGFERGDSIIRALSDVGRMNCSAALIGAAALSAMCLSGKFFKRIPTVLSGLILGALVYMLLSFFDSASNVHQIPVIGALHSILPQPSTLNWLFNLDNSLFVQIPFLQLGVYGLVLSVIGSMESLMSAVAIDDISAGRHDSRKELFGQGAGNVIASLFGALFSAGSLPRSIANYKAGARSRLSGMLCSLLILIIFLALAPLIGKTPLPLFAAVIIYVGAGLFSKTTVSLFKALRLPGKSRKDVMVTLVINLSVAAITVCINLVVAVIIGIAIAAAYFIAKTGTSVIRRNYTAQHIGSHKNRDLNASQIIKDNGSRIAVFELQGPIFFGSAERLAQRIITETENTTDCILDMKQVTEIDATGANILIRLHHIMQRSDRRLLLSHITPYSSLWGFLEVSGVMQVIPERYLFDDTDHALEWAEDRLLEDQGVCCAGRKCNLVQFDLLSDFDPTEIEIFRRNLDYVKIKKGEVVIREGSHDRCMYLLSKGSVSVKMQLPNSNRTKRLFTFDAGAVFGEMALLDGSPRSVNILADEDSEAFCLSHSSLEKLACENKQLTAKLMKNMALVLSHRLRIRSDELRMLEDN